MEAQTQTKEFLEKRPKAICAYSLNVDKVEYNTIAKLNIDLILIVEDIHKWHLENIKMNPGDYSLIGKIFYTSASKEKIKGLTGISYQKSIKKEREYLSLIHKGGSKLEPEFRHDFLTFNYGVVEYQDFERQLCSWKRITLSNLFQSNVLELIPSNKVDELIAYNRKNLLATALLLLGETSTLTELYEMILRLSKIQILKGQETIIKEEFIKIYGKTNEFYEVVCDEIVINRKKIESYFLPAYLEASLEGISKNDLEKRKKAIIDFFKQKEKEERYRQIFHDIQTNGIIRSAEYTFQKLKKKCTKR